MFHRKWLSHNDIFSWSTTGGLKNYLSIFSAPPSMYGSHSGRKIHPWGYWFSNQKRDTFTLFWNARLVNVMLFAITLTSHADVLRLVKRPHTDMPSWGGTRVTSLRTSAWEQLSFQLSVIKFKQRHLPITRDIDHDHPVDQSKLEVNTWRWQTLSAGKRVPAAK